jgi:hypothetical protein
MARRSNKSIVLSPRSAPLSQALSENDNDLLLEMAAEGFATTKFCELLLQLVQQSLLLLVKKPKTKKT